MFHPLHLFPLLSSLLVLPLALGYAPRDSVAVGSQFISSSTGLPETLTGANVVMKGKPWIPSTNGTSPCPPLGEDGLCDTFNEADARYFQGRGWNLIRLGVIWAGGQPTLSHSKEGRLDEDFERRLKDLLDLAHEHDLRVVLDLHQDAIGTSVCGEGLPVWYFSEHLPHLMGKPVVGIKSTLTGDCSVTDFDGWAKFSGDPEYNVKNECCVQYNNPGGGWGKKLDPSVGVQAAMAHLIGTEVGRSSYAAYVGLLAAAVADHPAAVGIELMNEPPILNFRAEEHKLYDLYEECYAAVRSVSDELAVGVADAGQVPRYAGDEHLSSSNKKWLESATHLMYTFHWYGGGFPEFPASLDNAAKRAAYMGAVPVLTEFHWDADKADQATEAGVMWTYYQYNGFCNVPAAYSADPDNGCLVGEDCEFGACIT